MMPLNTSHFTRCLDTLAYALERLRQAEAGSMDYEIYRIATVKGLDLSLETAGKLLRKVLKGYTGTPREIDELSYKDVLRHAGKHGFLRADAIERWFAYRDTRNTTAHDYGEAFAEALLPLLPNFLLDARKLAQALQHVGVQDAP